MFYFDETTDENKNISINDFYKNIKKKNLHNLSKHRVIDVAILKENVIIFEFFDEKT